VHTDLLGEPLVVWRGAGGTPRVMSRSVCAPRHRAVAGGHLPYTIVLRLGWGGQRGMVYFFASQPVAADRCAGYVVIGRNYNTDQPDQVIRDFEDTIFG
jgi:hypothetical protein